MNISKYNSSTICRICLNESSDMNNIFGNIDNNISNILISLADIQVIVELNDEIFLDEWLTNRLFSQR